ncbi:unnamed protein product [Phytophthora fragariaefolia]|uniref:Unnamed protein product n=1 Tax=Phytophthora fragariaefolia TaxID=1490495 RepID=A0A9W6WW45_9STRA|nr:unnamed protein product [Phytophthora fragariaefolia]
MDRHNSGDICRIDERDTIMRSQVIRRNRSALIDTNRSTHGGHNIHDTHDRYDGSIDTIDTMGSIDTIDTKGSIDKIYTIGTL